MDVVKVNWSGGKDSTCATILHIMRGDVCKVVNYIPMLNDTIPLVRKDHYEFILSTEDYFLSLGAKCYRAKGISYLDHVTRLVTKGRRKGRPYGTGLGLGFCNFKKYSKLPALNNVDIGEYDYEDIGIAYDEIKRQNQLNDKKRSILVEEYVTEQDAYDFCKRYRLLSPHYKDRKRDGCVICPNSYGRDLKAWCEDYEGAKECLLYIESICKQWTPTNFPFRDHKWFSDYLY